MKEFTGDADGYASTYMYKRRGVDKLFFGPGWDFDKGCENEWRIDWADPVTRLMIDVGFEMPGSNGEGWFKRLWQDHSFRSTVAARWASKRDQLKAEALRVLDEKPAAMRKSVNANFMVWDWNSQQVYGSKPPAATYELEVARVRTFINSRANMLDQLLQ